MGQPLLAYEELPEPEGRREWYVLNVTLVGPEGDRWHAVGLGETIGEALTWARKSAPAGTWWLVSDWSHLFGE